MKKNNEEQGNSTPKVNEVEYSTVLSLTVFNRKQTQNVCRVNPGKYGQRYKYGQGATNAHTKASLGCDSKASISPIICTFGFFADCILLDSVPLKQHNIPAHSDYPCFTVPFRENFKERAGLTQTISWHALWYFD